VTENTVLRKTFGHKEEEGTGGHCMMRSFMICSGWIWHIWHSREMHRGNEKDSWEDCSIHSL